MHIAILSDIHDHIWNLQKALQLIKEQKCEAVIYCGDFCSPFIPLYLLSLKLPIFACFGNNDEDQGMIIEKSQGQIKFWPLAEEFGEIELAGKKIAFCHYPKLGQLLAKTGEYAAVFHGHTHEAYQEQVGGCLLANPGAVCGIQSGKPGIASFGIHDTTLDKFEVINLSS